MKRVFALLLAVCCAVVSLSVLSGCGSSEGEEKSAIGAEVAAYLVGEVYDFDPAKAYTNDDAMKVMSLIYEPLFALDSEGNLEFALAKSYRFYDDRGEAKLDIELRATNWNDGSPVTASDVVYSWKRILDPDFPCQASTLLYAIKYARDAKLCNDKSVDDVAVTDQDLVLTITLEEELDEAGQQNFLRNLTSIALAPVKESAVTRADRDDYWSKRVSYIVTNGPFAIRAMDYTSKSDDNYLTEQFGFKSGKGHEFRLERNEYYRTNQETKNAHLYVTPRKFLSYWNTELDATFEAFINGTVFIVGDVPVAQRGVYLNQARVSNMLSTYTYVLDNDDPALANAKVRRAMSMAINRDKIVAEVTMGLGVAATGFVSHGVYNGASGSFSRVTAESDYALSTVAELEAAVALVKDAVANDDYKGGTLRILVRNNEEEIAIAEAVVSAWKELFKLAKVDVDIKLDKKSYTTFTIYEDETPVKLYKDAVQEAFRVSSDEEDELENVIKTGFGVAETKTEPILDPVTGEPMVDAEGNPMVTTYKIGYNVLAIDYQMLSPDAFASLASFSYEMSGNGIHMGGALAPSVTRTHVTGFNNKDYNNLIQAAYEEDDMAIRTSLLHTAEQLLLEEMPVIPVLFNQSATLVSGSLDRVYTSYYGYNVLNRAELRNWESNLIWEADDLAGYFRCISCNHVERNDSHKELTALPDGYTCKNPECGKSGSAYFEKIA